MKIEITNMSSLMTHYVRLKEKHRKKEKNYGIERWSAFPDYPMFYSLVKFHEPMYVFECGTNSGLSSMAFSLGLLELGRGKIFTWDIKEYDPAYENSNLEEYIISHKGNFHEKVGNVIKNFSSDRKLIFIDGNHNRDWAIGDFNSIKPYLKKYDVIVFHDSKSKGVKLALRKIKENYTPSREYELNSKCGIRVFVV